MRIFDAVKEIPLRNLVKTVIEVDSITVFVEKSVSVVRPFLELIPNKKIIVVTSTIPVVLELAQMIYGVQEPIWIHGKLTSQENINRYSEFSENPKKRLLIGTKLISEVIDVANLGAIVMCDYIPSITVMIQTAGRL